LILQLMKARFAKDELSFSNSQNMGILPMLDLLSLTQVPMLDKELNLKRNNVTCLGIT